MLYTKLDYIKELREEMKESRTTNSISDSMITVTNMREVIKEHKALKLNYFDDVETKDS